MSVPQVWGQSQSIWGSMWGSIGFQKSFTPNPAKMIGFPKPETWPLWHISLRERKDPKDPWSSKKICPSPHMSISSWCGSWAKMIGKATDVCWISGRSTYILNISEAMLCISILIEKVKHDRPSQQQQQQRTTNNHKHNHNHTHN